MNTWEAAFVIMMVRVYAVCRVFQMPLEELHTQFTVTLDVKAKGAYAVVRGDLRALVVLMVGGEEGG
jgi:hypothetical protein